MKYLLDIPENLHMEVKKMAVISRESMNVLITKAIQKYLKSTNESESPEEKVK